MKFNAYLTPLPSLKFSHSLSSAAVPSVTAFQLANKAMEPHNTCQTLSPACNCVYLLETQPKCRRYRQIKRNYFWATVQGPRGIKASALTQGISAGGTVPLTAAPWRLYRHRTGVGMGGEVVGVLKLAHMVIYFKPSSELRNSELLSV